MTDLEVSESEHNGSATPLLFLLEYQLYFLSFLLAQKHRLVAWYRPHDG